MIFFKVLAEENRTNFFVKESQHSNNFNKEDKANRYIQHELRIRIYKGSVSIIEVPDHVNDVTDDEAKLIETYAEVVDGNTQIV